MPLTEVKELFLKLLKLLVNSEQATAKKCLEEIQGNHITYVSFSPTRVHIAQALQLYSLRASMNEKRNKGIIQGFDALLANLQQTDEETIFILELITHEKTYVIFTDQAMKELFGVLITQDRNQRRDFPHALENR